MAKVLSRLDILLHANTANYTRDVKKATDKTKKELKSVANYGKLAGNQLGMAFAGLGSLVSISHIVQTADRMQDLASKVRINTQTTEEYNAVLQDLRKISTDYWTAIDGITDLYASSKRALDSLGASQRQVLDFTRNITMAMSVGGGSAQAQEAALIQLGQAMSMGVLRGQEFNSVSAQAPAIIDLLTDSLKVSRGELRQMAKDGKITSQVMMTAVLSGYDKLQGIINKMPTTFAQGVQNIKNQYDYLVDDIMNQNSLLSQNLANVALWTAENFRTLVGVGATLGAVWLANVARNSALVTSFVGLTGATLANTVATVRNAGFMASQISLTNIYQQRMIVLSMTKNAYIETIKKSYVNTIAYVRALSTKIKTINTTTIATITQTRAISALATAQRAVIASTLLASSAVKGLGTAFMSLGRIIIAHPIIALTAVIGAVIARTEGLGGSVKSLGDAFNVAGVLAVDFIGGVVDGLGTAWTATANYFNKLTGGASHATSFAQTAFGGFFAGTHKGFVGVGQIIARTFDLGGATVVWFVNSANKNIKALGVSAVNVLKDIGNFGISVFEKLIHRIIDDINALSKGANLILGVFSDKSIPMIGKENYARFTYDTPNFGSAGDIASYNSHYLEGKWTGEYQKMQDKANQASHANLGLATSLNAVADASDKASKGAKKLADANKEAEQAIKELFNNYYSQMREYDNIRWTSDNRFESELSKIGFEIEHVLGKFHKASESMKANLIEAAKEIDAIKANYELHGVYIDATRQIELADTNGSKYKEMAFDLQDTAKALHLAGQAQKDEILSTLATLEAVTKAREIQKQISDSNNELALLGVSDGTKKELLAIEQQKTQTLQHYNYLLADGYTEQYRTLQMATDILEKKQKQIVITKQYNDLVQSLKTDDKKHLEALKSQLNILTAHSQIMGTNLDTLRAYQLISQDIGLATTKDHYQELSDKVNSQYASLDTGLTALLDNERLTEQERINIKEWGANKRLEIEQAHSLAMNSLVLKDSESMFSLLANIAKDGLGEQSRLYRAMFAMQQGFAIAQAGLAMQQAISQGLAKGFPLGLGDMALAISHGAKIVSAIRSVVMPVGQAHDGIMSVPKSGTWNLEKGERVLPKHTAQNLDDKLNRLQSGGQTINVNVTVNANNSDVQSSHELGKGLGNAIKVVVQQELRKERMQGGILYGR